MASPPSVRDLRVDDLQAEDGQDRLASTVTKFMGAVHGALSGDLTLAANLRAQWHTTPGITVPDDWIALGSAAGPTLLNSFLRWNDSVYDSAAYRVDATGTLHMRGLVQTPPAGLTNPICVLPAAACPSTNHLFSVVSNNALAVLRVRSSGIVELTSGGTVSTWVSFRQVAFETAARRPQPAACWPYDFVCDFETRPTGVFLAEAREIDSSSGAVLTNPILTSGLDWDFIPKTGSPTIRIRNVPGLAPGKKYKLTFLVVDE